MKPRRTAALVTLLLGLSLGAAGAAQTLYLAQDEIATVTLDPDTGEKRVDVITQLSLGIAATEADEQTADIALSVELPAWASPHGESEGVIETTTVGGEPFAVPYRLEKRKDGTGTLHFTIRDMPTREECIEPGGASCGPEGCGFESCDDSCGGTCDLTFWYAVKADFEAARWGEVSCTAEPAEITAGANARIKLRAEAAGVKLENAKLTVTVPNKLPGAILRAYAWADDADRNKGARVEAYSLPIADGAAEMELDILVRAKEAGTLNVPRVVKVEGRRKPDGSASAAAPLLAAPVAVDHEAEETTRTSRVIIAGDIDIAVTEVTAAEGP